MHAVTSATNMVTSIVIQSAVRIAVAMMAIHLLHVVIIQKRE